MSDADVGDAAREGSRAVWDIDASLALAWLTPRLEYERWQGTFEFWLSQDVALDGLPDFMPTPASSAERCLFSHVLRAAAFEHVLRTNWELTEKGRVWLKLPPLKNYRTSPGFFDAGGRLLTKAKQSAFKQGLATHLKGGVERQATVLVATGELVSKVGAWLPHAAGSGLRLVRAAKAPQAGAAGAEPKPGRPLRVVSGPGQAALVDCPTVAALNRLSTLISASYKSAPGRTLEDALAALRAAEGLTELAKAVVTRAVEAAAKLRPEDVENGEGVASMPDKASLSSAVPLSCHTVRKSDFIDINPCDLVYERKPLKDSEPPSAGRFYAHFQWKLRAVERATIRLDGLPTIELDFKSFHPRIVAHLDGHTGVPEDLYPSVPGFDRALVKLAVNVALNSSTRAIAVGAIANRGDDAKDLRRAARRLAEEFPQLAADLHAAFWEANPLEPLNCTDVGRLLDELAQNPHFGRRLFTSAWKLGQAVDAEIASRVLLHFAKKGVPILGVHDSFVVAKENADELQSQMIAAYQAVVGTTEIPAIKWPT